MASSRLSIIQCVDALAQPTSSSIWKAALAYSRDVFLISEGQFEIATISRMPHPFTAYNLQWVDSKTSGADKTIWRDFALQMVLRLARWRLVPHCPLTVQFQSSLFPDAGIETWTL